ncbi:MAG: PSD1 domain-containing protein [Planctomycetales bacterium]|nr:PSD1 domain-containing protein [Planctomycetales bacterium]
MADKCFACHGPDANSRQADLRLDLPSIAQRVVEPGLPAESELIARVSHADPEQRMPPPSAKKQVSAADLQVLSDWIEQGAAYATHWSLSQVAAPALPDVSDPSWPLNEIDYFVLARLDREQLKPSQGADKTTLIRRVTLDLTGLPATPAEVDRFVEEDSVDAYEKAIDRLLATSRYGEHMAAPWLDAARYADTDGYQNDRYRYQWAWRDWVILALNDNMPYDKFVIEQLAGDMLPEATLRQQIATGFCRNHRINSEAGSIPEEWHVANVADRVDTFGTVFLGLTIGCARCHDHKYDPITQQEYYELFAFFNNVPEWGVGPNNGNSPPFVELPQSWPNLSAEEDRLITPAALSFQGDGKYQGGVVRPQPGGENTVMVMHEMETPRATFLLQRGQYQLPDKSEPLQPAVPKCLQTNSQSLPTNRLELAQWLTHPSNPLTARVAVNRYWQQFFGVGIVRTTENFGTQGEMPSHPELLDWLASEFVRSGWDVKAIQKKILLSATYRQSSQATVQAHSSDPENRLLARGPRYRLPAFALRDQALYVSGLLIEKFGGPSAKPYMPPKIWSSISNNTYEQDHGDNLYRRSIYTYWRRTIPPPTMMTFNSAEREVCIVRKGRTNTPLQALTLMNNVTFVESARFLAERMMSTNQVPPALQEQQDLPLEAGTSATSDQTLAAQLTLGMRLATGREPSGTELNRLADAYRQFKEKFVAAPESTGKLLAIGEKPRDEALNPIEHAAMTMVASILLNLDETISKE